MPSIEDYRPDPIRVPSPDAIEKHNLDLALIGLIEKADLDQITQVIDTINKTIAERPELLREDPSLIEKMKAAINRLAELTTPKEEETVH